MIILVIVLEIAAFELILDDSRGRQRDMSMEIDFIDLKFLFVIDFDHKASVMTFFDTFKRLQIFLSIEGRSFHVASSVCRRSCKYDDVCRYALLGLQQHQIPHAEIDPLYLVHLVIPDDLAVALVSSSVASVSFDVFETFSQQGEEHNEGKRRQLCSIVVGSDDVEEGRYQEQAEVYVCILHELVKQGLGKEGQNVVL